MEAFGAKWLAWKIKIYKKGGRLSDHFVVVTTLLLLRYYNSVICCDSY